MNAHDNDDDDDNKNPPASKGSIEDSKSTLDISKVLAGLTISEMADLLCRSGYTAAEIDEVSKIFAEQSPQAASQEGTTPMAEVNVNSDKAEQGSKTSSDSDSLECSATSDVSTGGSTGGFVVVSNPMQASTDSFDSSSNGSVQGIPYAEDEKSIDDIMEQGKYEGDRYSGAPL